MTARGVASVRATRANTTEVNTIEVNATQVNATQVNATRVNGTRVNGTQVNGARVNATPTATVPLATTAKAPSKPTTAAPSKPTPPAPSKAATTSPPDVVTGRRPRKPHLALFPVVAAMATALLGLGDFTRPILATDTESTAPTPHATIAATAPAAPVAPPCGPGATPAGHNPPTRVQVTTDHTYVSAGWLRWCTGFRESRTGPVKAAWIVMQLDRATVVASDVCLLHDCLITLTMSVPTRGPDLAIFRTRVDRSGPPQVTITTSAMVVVRHDFAEAHSANSTVFITPRGYAESV